MSKLTGTIEDLIPAIIAKDEGSHYSEVLENYGLEPTQFAFGVERLEELMPNANKHQKRLLEEISSNPARRMELFRMGEKFIQMQYDRIFGRVPGESQKSLYHGTLVHTENRIYLVYYALTSNNKQLASNDRKEVVHGLINLPLYHRGYFINIGLGGLIRVDSYFIVLELFDKAYQTKTGDKSLFDLNQKPHLHLWDKIFHVPAHYWDNPSNVELAVYHTLTEDYPKLTPNDRKEVVMVHLILPNHVVTYLSGLGISTLMRSLNHSKLAVLRIFDMAYQRETGDASLFDNTKQYHLEVRGAKHNKIRRVGI